jgi:CRISPR-associated endonuclease Csn1
MNFKYRLGLDLGTNSIGWFVTETHDDGSFKKFIDGNSRLFHDGREPKTKTSNAVNRREHRGARRMRDRKLQRMQKLLNFLVKKELWTCP